jgi:D-tyrosyl-tRNA(Tyr) deacylase
MRAVVQRVTSSEVTVAGASVAAIGRGLLVLAGVGHDDTAADVEWLAGKIQSLRIFEDDEGKMNRSIVDVGGTILLVSQFTLYADCRKGRRPSFDAAAPPALGEQRYLELADALRAKGLDVRTGVFRASMQVSLTNDGPVTMLLDSKRMF